MVSMNGNKGLSRELVSTFITFVESANITEAAIKLNLSQPAVSAQLKRLEEQTQFSVFNFQGKRKVLTHYGKELYHLLKEQESMLDQRYRLLNSKYSKSEELRLKIGLRKELFYRVVHQVQFAGQLQLIPMTGLEALDALAHRKIDIAITQREARQQSVVAKKLFSHGAKLVLPLKWLKTSEIKRAAEKKDFSQCQELWLAKNFLAYREAPPFLNDVLGETPFHREQLIINLICEDWFLLIEQIEQGRGFSVLPSDVAVSGRKVFTLDLPHKIVSPISFYAYYYPELRDVRAYSQLIDQLVVK